jgi:hypothetical protein
VEAKHAETATKSKLPKRKAWKGAKIGGAHNPACGAMGNSNEPKQIVSPRLTWLEVSETKAI